MFADHFLGFMALGVAVAGLVAIVAEMLIRDPATLLEVVTDVRAMALPDARPARAASAAVAANVNIGRRAA